MAKLEMDQILSAIEEMTVLELSDLVKKLEDKFGVSAAAPMAMAAMPAAAAPAAAAEVEEKTEFNCLLKEVGPEKIKVIKEVRALTGLGLKEAKAVVDEAPKMIKEAVPKEEAEKIKAKMAEVGAVVEIQ
jgi:large subunit ribosomal protein L7/L12